MSISNPASQLLMKVVLEDLCHHLKEDRIKEALAMSVYFTNNLCKLSHKRSFLRMASNFKITTKCLTRGLQVKIRSLQRKAKQLR
jgi:hypothetical protein